MRERRRKKLCSKERGKNLKKSGLQRETTKSRKIRETKQKHFRKMWRIIIDE